MIILGNLVCIALLRSYIKITQQEVIDRRSINQFHPLLSYMCEFNINTSKFHI